MKRYALDKLLKWKNKANRKPLIIKGARQVGKTWLMKEFGRVHFDNVAYVNLDNNERMQILFDGDFDTSRLIEGLSIESGVPINPDSTLIILDEIQEIPKAISSLKYFMENASSYAIVSAGSLLGVSMHEGISFPVGKVDFMDLYPLSFCEFLEAVGEGKLVELIQNKDWDLIKAFKNTYAEFLRKYYFIGGMPEVVAGFAENKDYAEAKEIQKQILLGYERDFSKHIPTNLLGKVLSVWDSVPAQLGRENKRFSPGIIKKNSRIADYEVAMKWLVDSGLLYKTLQISKLGIPLKSYTTNFFKIYIHDVGLLTCMSDLDVKDILEGNRIFSEFKGALTEQYVQQELMAAGVIPYYWSSEGKAEVDFIFNYQSDVIPLEVKAEENVQAKSLRVYRDKYRPKHCYRTSMRDYRDDDWLINVPLYGVGVQFKE